MKTAIPSLSRLVLVLFLLITIVLFYLINVNTPLICDDYWVIRVIEKHSDGTYSSTEKMISSIRELVQSWYYHRSYLTHGRISDYVGAAILVTGGKAAFNVLNTLVFIVYLWVFCKLCFHRFTLAGAAILLLTSIVVTPCITGTVFWVCGAMNYLWISIPLAIILMGVRKLEKDKTLTKCKLVLVCLCAFLCGAFHEGLGCTLGGAMALYWVIQRSKGSRLPTAYLWIVAILGFGTLIPLTAPAMWCRLGIQSGGNETLGITASSVLKSVAITAKNALLPLSLLSICLIRNWRAYVFSLIGCFVSMNLIMVIAAGSKGGWGGAYYFLGLGAGIFVLSNLPQQSLSVKWGVLFAIISLFLTGSYTSDSYKIKKVYDEAVSSEYTGNPRLVDITSMNGKCPFVLLWSLPQAYARPNFVYTFAQYHRQKPCRFAFQYSKPIPEIEASFCGLSKNEIHLRKCSGSLVLRLPQGCCMSKFITARQAEKPTLHVRPLKWELLFRIAAPFSNRKLARCGQFFAGGYCFLVLPEEVTAYSSIEVTLVNQRGEQTKSIIDLNPVK